MEEAMDAPVVEPAAKRLKTDAPKEEGVAEQPAPNQIELLPSESMPAAPADERPAAVPQVPPPIASSSSSAGAWTSREEHLQKLEQQGDIAFHYVLNDGTPQNMIWLIGLKNIYSKQLPNMPKEYICRLVLNRKHRSVALVKRNGDVMGGITYRTFPEQGLGEIAFCAVASTEQVKGFGTRLMNHTKQLARERDALTHFLTYADNNAVGYFAKQGFTREITMPRERWVGYIKDYDGGTLMEFVIHPKLPYTGCPEMFRAQRAALEAQMRTLSSSHVVHPGLAQFQAAGAAGGAAVVPLDIATIPGVSETGWRPEPEPQYKVIVAGRQLPATPENLQRFMLAVIAEAKRHPDSWPFREPVNIAEAPDYYDLVKNPIDLQSLEQRVQTSRYYVTLPLFVADMRLMMSNCRFYNAPETIYFKMANKMDTFLDHYLQAHVVWD